jgi:hypothetical protein
MPISPSDIRDIVTKEDDFGHEMRVGHAIRSCAGIESQHGGTYTDSITLKPRQFDFRCWMTKGRTRLSLAVECKNLNPVVPLVICGTARRDNEAFHDLIESGTGRRERRTVVFTGLSSVTRRASGAYSIYLPNAFVGKSLVRVQIDKMMRTPDTDIYEKWAQALSSSVDLATDACDFAASSGLSPFITSVLPIVVVPDGTLWKFVCEKDGTVVTDASQVNECEFFVGRNIQVKGPIRTPSFQQFAFSHIHFFTLSGFTSFLSKMAVNDHAYGKLFPETFQER